MAFCLNLGGELLVLLVAPNPLKLTGTHLLDKASTLQMLDNTMDLTSCISLRL